MRLDLASFNRAKKEIEKAGQGTDLLFVLVANKADQDTKREVSFQEGQEHAKELGVLFYEVSDRFNCNI